jgi:hypothetical protein
LEQAFTGVEVYGVKMGKLKKNYIIQCELRCCFNCRYFSRYYDMGNFCVWTSDGSSIETEKAGYERLVEDTGICDNFEVD